MKFLKDNGLIIGLIVLSVILLSYAMYVSGELKVKSDQIDNYAGWVTDGRIRGK